MEHHKNVAHHHAGVRFDTAIKALRDCAAMCEKCAVACIWEKDATAYARCIELTSECAAVCELGMRLLLRNSEIARQQLGVCAEACKRTAAECSRHYNAHCQICATFCRACEEACHALQEDSL